MRFFDRVRHVFRPRAAGDGLGSVLRELIARANGAAGADLGINVTPITAMQTAAVYSCVTLLAEDVAKLPLKLYQRDGKGGRTEATDHWLTQLMDEPNPLQTGFEFRELMQAVLELRGNFFALKTLVGQEVRELIPVANSRISWEVDKTGTKMRYTIQWPDGTSSIVPDGKLLHVRGLSLDGLVGVSRIEYQRELVARAMHETRYGTRLYKNGALIGGVFEHPGELSDEASKRLKKSLDEKYMGSENAHKTILLEEGMKFNKTGMTAHDAQYLESRNATANDIASIFRVPPHKIGLLDHATFSNVEQQSIDYVTDGLMGRLTRLEKRLRKELIPPGDRATLFLEHNVNALLRGDFDTRTKGYNAAVMTGWLTRNQVREMENMNPGPPELDQYLQPVNLQKAGDPPNTPPDGSQNVPKRPSQESGNA